MTRLTERNKNGGITVRDMTAALEKLAEYEDAEANGNLLKNPFPVKIGDSVFCLKWEFNPMTEEFVSVVDEQEVDGYHLTNYPETTELETISPNMGGCLNSLTMFKKTWYLTRSEAEVAARENNGT